jgi:acylphosphatase
VERLRRRDVAHGLVQGVWFRESARRRADELGIAGWVRNRADGAVEAELEGPPEDIEVLTDCFRRGLSGAQVERLEVEEAAPTGEAGFSVRR